MISKFGAYGACVGTIAAEYFVMIYQTIKVKSELDIKKYSVLLLESLIKDVGIMVIAYLFGRIFRNIYIRLIVQISLAVLLFFVLNYRYIVFEFLGKRKKNANSWE